MVRLRLRSRRPRPSEVDLTATRSGVLSISKVGDFYLPDELCFGDLNCVFFKVPPSP